MAIVLIGISLTVWILPNGTLEKIYGTTASLGYGALIFLAIAMPWWCHCKNTKHTRIVDYFYHCEHINASSVSVGRWLIWQRFIERRARNNLGNALFPCFLGVLCLIWQWVRSIKMTKTQKKAQIGFGSFLYYGWWRLCCCFSSLVTFLQASRWCQHCCNGASCWLTCTTKDHLPTVVIQNKVRNAFITDYLIRHISIRLRYKTLRRRNWLGIWKQQAEATQSDLFLST